MKLVTRGLVGAWLAAIAVAAAMFVVVPTASADGNVTCRAPLVPEYNESMESVKYSGTGSCTSQPTLALATWRVKVGLAEEVVNFGPIPNDWLIEPGTYTTYSTWAARGATRWKSDIIYCSDIQKKWKYKSKFWYQIDWADGHAGAYGKFSDDRKMCTD